MDLPPPIPQAIDWSTVFGTPTNFPDTQIINNRIEANRYYFIRTVVAGIGASAEHLAKLDRIVVLNLALAHLGKKPLCHADLVVMWNTAMEIKKLEAELKAAGEEALK
ncbi:Protein CBG00152 [Caenorhabditis briggsae]|uniref:Protein CBG00152 n=2 Tax=Caenorhabditis briggsae TaxID=6238 RepID=A8WMD9_CAEBR|nr:Protein CBG00152 [Caenorhabditis briggsae]ULT83563.1 hypothetical protein L3Y34_012653 [Caenorhabditis briggsae]CAP21643.1 Protein CBG00152 [Caenorhabditis briggsae]